jgi:hypothetical protein
MKDHPGYQRLMAENELRRQGKQLSDYPWPEDTRGGDVEGDVDSVLIVITLCLDEGQY